MSNSNSDDNSRSEWLTPKEAEQEYSIALRRIYRWIELRKVEVTGTKRETRISRSSLEREIEKARANVALKNIVDGQEQNKTTRRELTGVVASNVADLVTQRDRALARVEELQEVRRVDALALGELRGRIIELERQLEKLTGQPLTIQEQKKPKRWPWSR